MANNALEILIEALVDAKKDLEDAYAGKTKASATRARKALAIVKVQAHEARKELMAISKDEMEASPVDLGLFDVPAKDEE